MPVSFDTSMDEGYRMSMGVDTTGVPPGIGPSLDGFYYRRGDEGIAYVGDAEADYDQVMRTIETATTAVLGRVNADEFLVWWPSVIDTGKVDPRDEAYAKWLIAAETVGAIQHVDRVAVG